MAGQTHVLNSVLVLLLMLTSSAAAKREMRGVAGLLVARLMKRSRAGRLLGMVGASS